MAYPVVKNGMVTVYEQWSRNDDGDTVLVGRYVLLDDGSRYDLPLWRIEQEDGGATAT